MGKKVDNTVLDGSLAIIDAATEMYIVDVEPADRAAAVAAGLVGTGGIITLTGSFTTQEGTPDGREITSPVQTDVDIETTGNANHVCLGTATTLLLVTTCDTQGLSSGGTVTVPSFTYRAADPT